MDKELIQKKMKQTDQEKKLESDFVHNSQTTEHHILPKEVEQYLKDKKHLPKNMTDSPSHHEKPIYHKDHHKPLDSVIKNIEKKISEKDVEILSPK